MPQLDIAAHEHYSKNRHDEHSLQLKGEGRRNGRHGQGGLAVQRQIYAHNGEGRVYAVALPPVGAVEQYRGQVQNDEEADKLPSGTFYKQSA